MTLISLEGLASYLTASMVEVNIVVCFNLVYSLLLGLMVGYERSYHGRAAGMRTYGIVCMAATAAVAIAGHTDQWFGGTYKPQAGPVITQIIQGIVTGIGFLGAGVIMRVGLNISGLTTAASIWGSAVIGILVGIGFYYSALCLTLLTTCLMMWGHKLENMLPSRHAISVVLHFLPNVIPDTELLNLSLQSCDYAFLPSSLSVSIAKEITEWQFIAVALSRVPKGKIPEISQVIQKLEGLKGYSISYARN